MTSRSNVRKTLDGRVVLITGAGRGVGRGHALTLAAEGARVVVNDPGYGTRGPDVVDGGPAQEVVELIRHRGGEACPSVVDISTWAGAGDAVELALSTYGQLDGLVANAGVHLGATIFDASEADFDTVIGVNLRGTFACMHHAMRHWKQRYHQGERFDASVVNTVSDAMFLALSDPLYGAAKAAIAHLTLSGCVDGAPIGVRVNAIAPRADTRMSRSGGVVSYPVDLPPRQAEEYTEDSPLDPSNSSPIVAWLLSDRSRHVSGQVFRTLAGAFARGQAWTSGEWNWPASGKMKFTVDEVETAMNQKIFGSQYVRGRLEFAPGDPRHQD